MVGAGVLAQDDDQLGLVDVLEGDRALADADGLLQRHRGRLVTHVRAVRQVVGAVGAGEELVEVRRLVRHLAGGVEDRLVGLDAPQVARHQGEGVLPGDGLVVRPALAQDVGLGDAPLLVQPVVGVLGKLRDRVLGEERGLEQVRGGLVGDGLGAVLAELRRVPVVGVGIGPRAALAVEAVDLVEAQQRASRSHRPHVLDGPLEADRDGFRSRCGRTWSVDLDARLVDLVQTCASSHPSVVLAACWARLPASGRSGVAASTKDDGRWR